MTPSNTTQGAKRITPDCQPVFPCWLWQEPYERWVHFKSNDAHPMYGIHYTHWHPDQPTAPASPSPVTEETKGELSDMDISSGKFTRKQRLAHGLRTISVWAANRAKNVDERDVSTTLSVLLRKSKELKDALARLDALPTPSPSAPAQAERIFEVASSIEGECPGVTAPSAAQQDKGWADQFSWLEEVLRQETHLNAAGRDALCNRILQRIARHAPPSATPSSLSAQGGAADQDFPVPKYRSVPVGEFGPSEWLELLMCCQSGYATCLRVMEYIDRETVPIGCLKKLHPKSLEVCYAIERLPAGEQQTALSIQASAVAQEIQRLAATPPNAAPEAST